MYATKEHLVNKSNTLDFASKNPIPSGFKSSARLAQKSLLGAFLSLGIFSAAEAQTVTVNPPEHPEAITNPGIGYRRLYQGSGDVSYKSDYSTVAKHYVPWASMETSATEDIGGIINGGNTNWAQAPTYNIKITPRSFLHYYLPVDGNNSPAHFQPLDYSSETTRDNVLRVIRKLGKVWDKDPRILSVETGILGAWGEQQQYLPYWADYDRTQHPISVSSSTPNAVSSLMTNNLVGPEKLRWEKILADAFREAFPNKPLVVREMGKFFWYGNDYPFSTYWDLFAGPGQYGGTFQELLKFGDRTDISINNNTPFKRYLHGPILGEIDWQRYLPSLGPKHSDPQLMVGSSGGELIGNNEYSKRFDNYVRSTHLSVINGMGVENIDPKNTNLQNILKSIGYRFHISEFTISNRVEPGATFTINAKIKNLGSAPIYQNYPVAFFLLNKQTDANPVFTSIIPDIDTRKWLPGSDFDWEPKTNPTGTQVYLNPAVDNLITASITIPATLAKGDYFAGIAILEPSTGKPAVYIAIPNFFKASQTQPLCRIGVGQNPVTTSLTGVTFDVMNSSNDTRNYDLAYYKTLPEVKVEVIKTGTTTGPSTETSEPSGKVQFKFTRQASDTSNPLKTDKALKVTFAVAGTATNGVDYQALPTSVMIPIGSTSVTMDLNVLNDSIRERAGETVVVNLTSNQINYYLTSTKQATVTINDDGDFDGNVELLGSWVNGYNNPVKSGTNRALVVLPTGMHLKSSSDLNTTLKVASVTYGGVSMSLVTENPFEQGTSGNFAYAGAFVLGEAGIKKATSDEIKVTWQMPTPGGLWPNVSSNIASAFFSNVKQLVSSDFPATANPLKNGAKSVDYWQALSFDTSSTPEVDEFKNEAGDYIITAGAIYPRGNVYRVDSGFTSFLKLLPDGTYETGSSGDYYGFKPGTGVAERPTFYYSHQDRKSMVGFVLKKAAVYSLSTAASNGTVALDPPGGAYSEGQVVTVTAIPSLGYAFGNWGEGLTGSVNPTTITMNANQSVTATFTSAPTYTLSASGINGKVTLDPPGPAYNKGTVVTVTAMPDSRFGFTNWSGGLSGSVNPATITMNTNQSVTATFTAVPTYTLTTSGLNGSVDLNPPGGTYYQGTVVTVTALPSSGFTFSNWSGNHTGTANPTTITMNANKTFAANFTQNVNTLTGWVSGTTNTKVSGINRLMTVMVMGESSGDFSATSVTYGGQTMIKRSEKPFSVTGNRTYAAMFTLSEAGVSAAASGSIAVNWSTTPSVGSAVYSVLLAGVDQTNPVSTPVVTSVGLSGTSISTTPFFAGSGDMVIMCGATENNTDITYNNGFTEQFEANASWGDATAGSKMGVGANETPSFSQSAAGRMVLCAMVIKKAVPTSNYTAWLALNSPATGFAADTDKDGLANGLERVFGSNPNTYSSGLTLISATASSVTYQHPLNPNIASDISYSYEWSTDLIEWKASGETNTGGTIATINPSAPVSGIVTVTTTVSRGSATKLLTRLKAVQ